MSPSPSSKRLEIIVVDDSVIDREICVAALEHDERFHVVAVARNGRDALDKLEKVGADALVLDLNMPELDGFQLLDLIKSHEDPPQVVVVSASEREEDRRRALAGGARAFVLKPGARRGETALTYRTALVAELEQLSAPLPAERPAASATARLLARSERTTSADGPVPAHGGEAVERGGAPPPVVDVVVVGASTGGPDALHRFVTSLPTTFTTPLVVTQHMPAGFTAQFASRLDRSTHYSFTEASGGERVEPGRAFLAPGGKHLVFERRGTDVVLRLDDGPPENSCKPAVDPMFRSAVTVYGPHVAALVFTGMGMDGLDGARSISASGGWVMVQDEATSVVWGMPGYVARAGVADRIVPLDDMAPELVRSLSAGTRSRR